MLMVTTSTTAVYHIVRHMVLSSTLHGPAGIRERRTAGRIRAPVQISVRMIQLSGIRQLLELAMGNANLLLVELLAG